ncbi:EutP/PduV family microcompartment system protein [Endozoicomonas sp. Mp262]
MLKAAGVKTIFEISAVTGEGLENLKSFLKQPQVTA